jgi:hypothetical protein
MWIFEVQRSPTVAQHALARRARSQQSTLIAGRQTDGARPPARSRRRRRGVSPALACIPPPPLSLLLFTQASWMRGALAALLPVDGLTRPHTMAFAAVTLARLMPSRSPARSVTAPVCQRKVHPLGDLVCRAGASHAVALRRAAPRAVASTTTSRTTSSSLRSSSSSTTTSSTTSSSSLRSSSSSTTTTSSSTTSSSTTSGSSTAAGCSHDHRELGRRPARAAACQ